MAETLTYNPEEVQDGEFTAEEQDSLAVGEQIAEQEAQLLAGKYRDAEELEQAYLELQTKLGKPEQEQQEEVQEEQEEVEETDNFLETLWEEAQGQEFTEETMQRLNQINPGELAKMYLEYRNNAQQAQTPTITEQQSNDLRNLVGGDEAYTNLVGWAGQNLSDNEVEMYDYVMEQGNPAAMYFAVSALYSKYSDSIGVEGEMLTGSAARSTRANAFRSQAELVRAIEDPRYENDPAYRNDVMQLLENSNLEF
tara:strand:- start:163 stop:921 length:759 start_codon:yes stop_codon:yes gene_type:complete